MPSNTFKRLGVGGMDTAHLILWNIVHRIQRQIDLGNGTALIDHLELLVNSMRVHFTDEEMLMQGYDFPDLSEHSKEHYNFIETLYTFRDLCMREDDADIVNAEFKKIKTEIAAHIEVHDQKAAIWIRENPRW